MDPWYATREDVMSGTDVKVSARNAALIDADIESASRTAELLIHRKFYPWYGTRYFDWPGEQPARSWRLWFDQFDLTTLDSIANGDGSAIPTASVFLNPQDGPPFEWAEVSLATTAAFRAGSTWQRSIGLTGTWGWANAQTPAGTLSAGINASVVTVGVSDSSLVGVGSLLTVGTERMQVTGKAQTATGTALSADLTANAGVVAVPVVDATKVHTGEVVTVGTERMQVVDVIGNTLSVKRAVQGAVLAVHTTGDTVYAPRSLTVVRAATGTTAASHSNADPVTTWVPPGPIHNLVSAIASESNAQRVAGWTSVSPKPKARIIDDLTAQVSVMYSRFRTASV